MKNSRRAWGLVTLVVIILVAFFAVSKKRAIADWWELRGYTPPSTVVTLANQDTMTAEAKHIFYVNHPQIISSVATFRQQCNFSEQTIVLGCYHSDQLGIDIYDVSDPRLNGVEQVTAAHEMLHAAYDRLSSKQKSQIDAELMDFYNHLDNPRITQTINLYKQTEPNDVVNEMHSIFGTEIASLPSGLESYYKQYFSNRPEIAQFAAAYEGEFTSRLDQINADDQQLAALKAQIQSDEQSLDSQLAGLQADRASVERSDSQAVIDSYNARVNAYNAGVRQLQSEIDNYNTLVDQRNSIATALKSLQNSIDTRLTTQPAQ